MKRSEFRELVREVLSEALPEIFDIISEIVESNNKPIIVESNKQDLSSIKQHVRGSISERGYDLPSNQNVENKASRVKSPSVPNNPKGVVNGETYASGRGIMEWFEKSNGKIPPQTEFKHSDSQIEDYINKKFRKK